MSIWNKDAKTYEKRALNENKEVDTLIIGAGITGLTLGYYLKDENIMIVDASKFGYGTSLNSTAKITYMQGILHKTGNPKKYLESQMDAIKDLVDIINKEKINCDLIKTPSYLFALTNGEVKNIRKEENILKKNGIKVTKEKLPSKITNYASICVSDTYTFNVYKYLDALYQILNKNIPIYENTRILKIEKNNDEYICYGEKYHIKCKRVVIACHYPFFLYPFVLPLKSYIEKSYIVISKVKENKNFSCISTKPIYSCRFYEDKGNIYQISLSESHNTAIKQNDAYHFSRVKEIFNLENESIIMEYSNTDIMTFDNMPYIGEIKKNIFVATGYNTWGMTNGVMGAKILSDLILGKKNRYKDLFDPKRFSFIKLPYFLISQIKSYFGPKILKNKPWYKNVTIKGDIATYIDKDGKEHAVYNKCPHLGCNLIFNEVEETWDCPCHSSRFDKDGKCIKGPSKYDITYKKQP